MLMWTQVPGEEPISRLSSLLGCECLGEKPDFAFLWFPGAIRSREQAVLPSSKHATCKELSITSY